MDFSRLSRNQLIIGGGGIALIFSLFLNWDNDLGGSAFDLFSGVDIILLVVGLAAVTYVVVIARGDSGSLPDSSAALLSLLGVLGTGMALSIDLEDSSAGVGAWLGLIGAGAIAFGGHQAGSESKR